MSKYLSTIDLGIQKWLKIIRVFSFILHACSTFHLITVQNNQRGIYHHFFPYTMMKIWK